MVIGRNIRAKKEPTDHPYLDATYFLESGIMARTGVQQNLDRFIKNYGIVVTQGSKQYMPYVPKVNEGNMLLVTIG